MNKRQRKKRGLPVRRRAPDPEACIDCCQFERCIEHGRGQCTQYRSLKDIQDEIRRINAEMQAKM